jgi:cytochrome c-type biogenesis protein CcmH/NrfG
VSKRLAWIIGACVVLVGGVGLALFVELSAAHGLTHAAHAGDVERVLAAVRRKPQEAGLWELLGDAYRARSDYEQAVRAYQRALQLNSADENTWWLLGIAEVCRNNPEGIATVQRALQRLNGQSAAEFAGLAPKGCCAFGGCAR